MDSNQVFDFSIFTRRRSIPLSLSTILPTITGTDQYNHDNRHTASQQSPRRRTRRPWLQLGSGGSRTNELGVRETYQFYNATTTSITTGPPNGEIKVRYTRYGEAPVWYGPGRVCVLELVGTRIKAQHQTPSTRSRDDTDIVVGQVLDVVQQHVPVITAIVRKYIPDFWNVLPTVSDSTPLTPNQRRTTPREKQDETNFLYYATALHPALQLQDGEEMDGNDNDKNTRRPFTVASSTAITTANEFRQYYNDLAIGRRVQELLNPSIRTNTPSPTQQLLQSIEYERRRSMSTSAQRRQQIIQNVQSTVFSAWDKLRTASTLSIW